MSKRCNTLHLAAGAPACGSVPWWILFFFCIPVLLKLENPQSVSENWPCVQCKVICCIFPTCVCNMAAVQVSLGMCPQSRCWWFDIYCKCSKRCIRGLTRILESYVFINTARVVCDIVIYQTTERIFSTWTFFKQLIIRHSWQPASFLLIPSQKIFNKTAVLQNC